MKNTDEYFTSEALFSEFQPSLIGDRDGTVRKKTREKMVAICLSDILLRDSHVQKNNGGQASFEWFFPEEGKDRRAWADAFVRTIPQDKSIMPVRQPVQIVFGNFFGTKGFIEQNTVQPQPRPGQRTPLLLTWNHYNAVCAKHGRPHVSNLVDKQDFYSLYVNAPFDEGLDSFYIWKDQSIKRMVDDVMCIIEKKKLATSGKDVILLVALDSGVPGVDILDRLKQSIHDRLAEQKFSDYAAVWVMHNQVEAVSCWPGLGAVGKCTVRFDAAIPENNAFQSLDADSFSKVLLAPDFSSVITIPPPRFK